MKYGHAQYSFKRVMIICGSWGKISGCASSVWLVITSVLDVLIGVDNVDLHYSFVDVCGKLGEPGGLFGSTWVDLHWTSRWQSAVWNKNTPSEHCLFCGTRGRVFWRLRVTRLTFVIKLSALK